MQVKLFIQSLSKVLAKAPKKAVAESGGEDQNVAKLFEEVKAMVRELPERVDSKFLQISRRTPYKAMRHLHPKMLEEILFVSAGPDERGGTSAAALLLILSLVKDDIPWLHEVGMAIYRAMVSDDSRLVKSAHRQFQITMELAMHGPWRRNFSRDDEDSFMLSHYLPELIERAVKRYMESAPIRRRLAKSIEESGVVRPS